MDKKALVGIADQIKELDNLEKDLHQLKQEKGQLGHDINLLKKNKEEISIELGKKQAEFKVEISDLEKIISNLQAKRDTLVANTAPEIAQLNSLRQQISGESSALDKKQENINKGFESLSKEQARIEEKKKVLGHITELAELL